MNIYIKVLLWSYVCTHLGIYLGVALLNCMVSVMINIDHQSDPI